jgi:hypothetical protein
MLARRRLAARAQGIGLHLRDAPLACLIVPALPLGGSVALDPIAEARQSVGGKLAHYAPLVIVD